MEHTTPLFFCKSPDETLTFYKALGFTLSYRQDTPYLYAAVSRGAINLHFTKGKTTSTCLVHVPEVSVYHRAFADGLRAKYGRIPTAGFPRIARLKPGRTRFPLFDPMGNELLFINQDEPDIDYDAYDATLSPLVQALENVAFLRDTYADDEAAAKFLDKKLRQHTDAPSIDRARALASRAELAVAMGEAEQSRIIRNELEQIPLSAEERDQYRDELEAADRLERWLTQADTPTG